MHIDLHIHAKEDLLEIRAVSPTDAASIMAALAQVEADPKAADKLTTYGENQLGTARLGVKRWQAIKGAAELWRFRAFDCPATNYRVIYGYHWQTRQICVLAVVHKEEFDYDDLDSDIATRIITDWRNI